MLLRSFVVWSAITMALLALTPFVGHSETRGPLIASRTSQVSFLNDVEPILTRAGCNAGACHGSQFGKGSFKLSLAAYDPDLDYQSITRASGGRRLNMVEPERSLFLRKPVLQDAHQGGMRLQLGSSDYQRLLIWIKQGAFGPDARDPSVVELTAHPPSVTLTPKSRTDLKVKARFSDGKVRDVTRHTRIGSLDELIASATPEGRITAVGRGATAIMLRYAGLAAVTHVTVPYSNLGAARQAVGHNSRSEIDRLVAARWRDLGLQPSPAADDYTFLRRASLDVTGSLPTPEEVRRFAADRAPEKRARLIDALLDRPEYADHWAIKWSDLLRVSRSTIGTRPAASLAGWVRSAFASNMPFDQFARELLTGQGPADGVASANFYRVASTPEELTETTSQLFLGVRLQCARCHHHPFEKWSQSDYYRFAALFARVSVKQASAQEPVVLLKSTGEVTHPKSGARMVPSPLMIDGSPHFVVNGEDRREAFADWLTDRTNLAFARTIANRYWGYLMGRGLVEPVDDVRVTNPPSNPLLLDELARGFVRSGYDIKALIRSICNSKPYQISSDPTANNRSDRMFYSHYLRKRQSAEVLLDSIGAATGVREKFPGIPAGTRAIQLSDSSVSSMFLDTFGRPPRSSACECERVSSASLPQALLLVNGGPVNAKVASVDGTAAVLAASGKTETQIIDALYLAALNRPPRHAERVTALGGFRARPRREAAEDLLWALLNTSEFAYIR